PVDGQWAGERIHDRLSVSLGWNSSRAGLRLEYTDDSYSGGTHGHFRQSLYDFWLDEDIMRPSDIFFADSGGHSSLRLSIDEKGRDRPGIPYKVAGTLSAEFSSVKAQRDIWRLEARLARGLRLSDIFAVHLDMRYVGYGHPSWEGKDSFLDLWAGLSVTPEAGPWITAGVGKAPVSFDEWIYGFTPFAREKYLLESLSPGTGTELTGSLETLREAERSMSEDWGLSVQAGFSF
ncbi:MAG TPA: hypothetical protein VLA34_10965, partial [Candidatus Krumholzibacterium sp.]|nr:hypothetical protein [Candidatus Krumholzibacterium sp.]